MMFVFFFYSIPVGNLKIVEIVFETVFDRESNKNGLIFFRGGFYTIKDIVSFNWL